MRRNNLKILVCIGLIFYLFLPNSYCQDYPYWDGNTFTFEITQPSKGTSKEKEEWRDSQRVASNKKLEVYEETALKVIEELNAGMTKLIDPTVSSFNKSLIKVYISSIFQDTEVVRAAQSPTYRGLAFDETSNEIRPYSSKDLESYLDFLIKSSQDKLKMNLCWGMDASEERFEFKKMATSRIRPSSKNTQDNDTIRYYVPYNGSITVKEYAAFNTFTVDERICKNINFELRVFEKDDTEGLADNYEKYYDYTVILKSVTIDSDDKKCKELQPECDPETESPIESSDDDFSMSFDFGNGKSTKGYTNVNSNNKYAKGNEFGFISTSVPEAFSECKENGAYCENTLEEDYLIFKVGDKFKAKVPNGYYFVQGTFNKQSLIKNPKVYKIKIEDQWKRIVNDQEGNITFIYKTEVEDGFLDLEFGTLGGTSKITHIPFSALEIKKNVLWFDFGPGEVADSFVQVQKQSIFRKDSGFGLKTRSDVIGEGEKKFSQSDRIKNDSLILNNGAMFKCVIPNGSYDVELITDNFKSKSIAVEGKKRKTSNFTALVKDNLLEIEFLKAVPINGIKIKNAGCYKVVSPSSYLIPGKGLNELRKRKGKRLPLGHLITVATVGSIGTGIYYKIESNRHYKTHRNASTFDELNSSYEKANSNHHNFLIFTGAGLATWLVSGAVIYSIDGRQFRKCRQNFEEEELTTNLEYQKIELKVSDSGVGLGLNLNF